MPASTSPADAPTETLTWERRQSECRLQDQLHHVATVMPMDAAPYDLPVVPSTDPFDERLFGSPRYSEPAARYLVPYFAPCTWGTREEFRDFAGVPQSVLESAAQSLVTSKELYMAPAKLLEVTGISEALGLGRRAGPERTTYAGFVVGPLSSGERIHVTALHVEVSVESGEDAMLLSAVGRSEHHCPDCCFFEQTSGGRRLVRYLEKR